jgi:hypothetical protein
MKIVKGLKKPIAFSKMKNGDLCFDDTDIYLKISDAEDRPGDKLVALSDGTTYMPDDNENFIMIGNDCGFFEEQKWSRLPPSNTLPRPVYFEEIRHKYPGTVIFYRGGYYIITDDMIAYDIYTGIFQPISSLEFVIIANDNFKLEDNRKI